MAKRATGFYWIRRKVGSDWRVAEWLASEISAGTWIICGDDGYYDEDDIAEIGERQIVRAST
ncbi:MAG: hypothetical protein V4530_06015 [Pseudomonadota bacterium]